jgi:hypothetical protein
MASQTFCRPRRGNLGSLSMGAAAHDGYYATHKKRLDAFGGPWHRLPAHCGGRPATKLRVMQPHPDGHARPS